MRFDPKDARETAWFLAISGYIPFLLLALGLVFIAPTSPWHAGPDETAVYGDRSDRQERAFAPSHAGGFLLQHARITG